MPIISMINKIFKLPLCDVLILSFYVINTFKVYLVKLALLGNVCVSKFTFSKDSSIFNQHVFGAKVIHQHFVACIFSKNLIV